MRLHALRDSPTAWAVFTAMGLDIGRTCLYCSAGLAVAIDPGSINAMAIADAILNMFQALLLIIVGTRKILHASRSTSPHASWRVHNYRAFLLLFFVFCGGLVSCEGAAESFETLTVTTMHSTTST
jgi:hypothetical protein